MIYKVNSYLELHEQLLEIGLWTRDIGKYNDNVKCGLCSIEIQMKNSKITEELGNHIRRFNLKPITNIDIYRMEMDEKLDVGSITSDIIQLGMEGLNTTYWGSESNDPNLGIYTPLRQNIVLLLAALNDEL